jgi:hypothetical protein
MYYYFVLNHPAHFHLFKNTIKELVFKGHECEIFIRPKDILKELLDNEVFQYIMLPEFKRKNNSILFSSALGLIRKDFQLTKSILNRKPDLLLGTDWAITNMGRLFNIPSLVFNEDDTNATPENKLFYPLATNLILPDCCDKGLWMNKRISYAGYHELAYLHPKRFTANKEVVLKNINYHKPFIIIRLVKLTASHDKGKKGLGLQLLNQIIENYKKRYQILISFEGEPNQPLKEYCYRFDPSLMHHFLAEAHLVIGDSQTMIAEAAVLGTPSIRFNDFVGKLGYLEDLEYNYELTNGIKTSEPEKLLAKIDELLSFPNIKEEWTIRKEKMLHDKIDVTAFIVWFVENYPQSLKMIKENSDYQNNFK